MTNKVLSYKGFQNVVEGFLSDPDDDSEDADSLNVI